MTKLLILAPSREAARVMEAGWPRHLTPGTAFYGESPSRAPTDEVMSALAKHGPDVCCYIGTPGPQKPLTMTLLIAKKHCGRLVHWLCDGACPEWHPLLEVYKTNAVFDLTINVDGNDAWPQREGDVTALFPTDPARFDGMKMPRDVPLGFSGGGWGGLSQRARTVDALGERLALRGRGERAAPWSNYAAFLLSCQAVLNDAWCGSGKAMQAKNRVVEAGLAGCLLFENENSPTQKWFEAGRDYLEYRELEQIVMTLDRPDFADLAWGYGQRLRERVLALDWHNRFWKLVMGE